MNRDRLNLVLTAIGVLAVIAGCVLFPFVRWIVVALVVAVPLLNDLVRIPDRSGRGNLQREAFPDGERRANNQRPVSIDRELPARTCVDTAGDVQWLTFGPRTFIIHSPTRHAVH